MDADTKGKLAARLADWSHLLLAAHLMMLHVLAFGGWKIPAVRLLWVAALGLFLIWQPFVAGERRISLQQGAVLFVVALGSTWILGPWLLLIWCGALAAAIGGRVLWTERRGERTGYLLALGYVIGVTIFGVVPEISPKVVLDPLPRDAFLRLMPFLLPLLLVFPARAPQRRAGDAFDLFYGMLVFLVLAVFVLGALAYMLVGGVDYVEALFSTSLTMAGALLVVAWSWNPRAGFSGVGSAVSRYLLSVGMPLEQWLVQLAEENEREADPAAFLRAVMGRLQSMPWVVGSSWEAAGVAGESGERTAFSHQHQATNFSLAVYFRVPPSPSMRWHVEWLLRLAAEFYLVKRQTHELQRMSYLQAVYETGSRVTHDVKNLLQSMQGLCYAAAQPGDPAQLAGLLGKQLPLITERLRVTLEKLQTPLAERGELVPADEWWRRLRARYATSDLTWRGGPAADERLPANLFDSVAENLLQNALAKRQRHPGLGIEVSFVAGALSVADDGSPLAPPLAAAILHEPVDSEDGLGIGLYHAARQADAAGYALALSENRPGRVVFSLSVRH
ncbi:MAG: ATP-binding protein [Betaproteobacteria bacterium HGW-Betaproteobacteria-12]|nr:MAG: ATP-binding protein [Betaproteobacteria bacterium HGW-Betaproteobacteria-12]